MRYRWLLFDADGTLFDYDQAEATALEQTFRQFGIPFQPHYLTAYQQINGQLWKAFEQRQITPDVIGVRRFEQLFAALKLSILTQTFSTAYLQNLSACTFLLDGAETVLRRLHSKYQIAILTNGLKDVQRPRLAHSTIRGYVSELIISEEVGVAKPDPGIFAAAFERMGRPRKSEVLMVGDSLTSDIQGGAIFGVDTCWFNPSGQPRPPEYRITCEIHRLDELVTLLKC
jgi:YjjG family noncanonical pyrimidine nucleotidase